MLRSILFFAFSALVACHPFSPQTRHITETWFADPAPDLALTTPAFGKAHGFTKHRELVAFLERVAAADPRATLSVIGQSQKGRDIPLIRFAATESPTIRVWLQGGLHGNEPASSEGLLTLIDHLAHDPAFADVRARVEIAIVPVANVDGYQIQSRYAANGRDLNRDQTKLMVEETLLLRRAFLDFDPQVAVDFHEYRPYRRDFVWFGENGATGAYDVMFLYSGNLNVPAELRSFTDEVFVQAARDAMDAHGLTHHPYVTTRDVAGDIHFNQGSVNARSSATSFALSRTVSTLIEVRGVGLQRDGFPRRVKTTYWIASAYVRAALEHADEVHRVLDEGADPPDVTVRSAPEVDEGTLMMIDLLPRADLEVPVVLRDNLRSQPILARSRPEAYAILPGHDHVLTRLESLGLSVERLDAPRRVPVERYVVDAYTRDPYRYEGMHRQTVHTRVDRVERELPAGSALVQLDQARGNLLPELLEPEAPNSFVSFGVLRVHDGDELPIYRTLPAPPAAP